MKIVSLRKSYKPSFFFIKPRDQKSTFVLSASMVLFLIGLGLGNIKDITVKGIFSGYACAANCKHKGLITKSSGWDIHSDIFDKLLIKTNNIRSFLTNSIRMHCSLVLFYMIEKISLHCRFIRNFGPLGTRTQKSRDKTIGF